MVWAGKRRKRESEWENQPHPLHDLLLNAALPRTPHAPYTASKQAYPPVRKPDHTLGAYARVLAFLPLHTAQPRGVRRGARGREHQEVRPPSQPP